MIKMTLEFGHKLKTTVTHEPSSTTLKTSAPVDNNGDGSTFSPTDLFATSALTCLMTIMGIAANKRDIELAGMTGSVEKHMFSNPRRIGKLIMDVHVPFNLNPDDQEFIERAGLNCPVFKSVHPDLEKLVTFHYPE